MWQKIIAFFAAIIAFLSGLFSSSRKPTPEPETGATFEEIFDGVSSSQTDYIISLSQSDGSITEAFPAYDSSWKSTAPDYNGVSADTYTSWNSSEICPYFSCIAAIGLIEAEPEKGRETAEKYIEWHFNHLNTSAEDKNGVDGTIYDYMLFVNPNNTSETLCIPTQELKGKPEESYDSSDSYAALFLKLLYTYEKNYPDSEYLNSRKDDAQRVINALYSTYIPSLKLTAAKPDYGICYLMDNCEVYEGLVCASKLFTDVWNDSEKGNELKSRADDIADGIEKEMYSSAYSSYYSSVSDTGEKTSEVSGNALKSFYPNGVSQLYPIICGLAAPSSERATTIYNKFSSNFGTTESGKSWQNMDIGSSFPWAAILEAAVMMNDTDRASDYIAALKTKYLDNGCKYPYYCAEAGHVLSAVYKSK